MSWSNTFVFLWEATVVNHLSVITPVIPERVMKQKIFYFYILAGKFPLYTFAEDTRH